MLRNFFVIVVLSFFCISCNDTVDFSDCITSEYGQHLRTLDDAVAIAQKNIDNLFPSDSQGRSVNRSASVENVKIIRKHSSRSTSGENLMYVVNFDDDNGFVIVPCNDCADDVLAVVPKGNYDPDEPVDNPGFNMFIDASTRYLSSIIPPDGPLPLMPDTLDPVQIAWTDTIYHYHGGPIMNLQWGQRYPYGWFCPNQFSGCVPTAIAAVMAYLHFQKGLHKTMTYTFPERDIDTENIDWTEVYRHNNTSLKILTHKNML